MKILVFGAGGVGSVFGAFLARMGHEVSLLGRRWHLDVIRKQGLLVTGLWGDYRVKALECYDSIGAVREARREYDLILLTVKAYDTAAAAEELAPLLGERTCVASIQNGLGNLETLQQVVARDRILACRVIFGVETAPGTARVTVSADANALGALPGASPLMPPERLARELTLAKLETRAVPAILPVLWSKAIYNCALNALCSLHEIPYGRVLEDPERRSEMRQIIRECYAVASANGISLEPPDAEAFIGLMESLLIPRTAAHFPSMLQDLRRGKRLEIEALNGAIVRMGSAAGVATPLNDSITQRILALEKNRSGA